MREMEDYPREALWRWIWLVTFAIAFAWVESAVVIYLRHIYYDGIFDFPITIRWEHGLPAFDQITFVELGREAATILMLVAAGCLAGRSYWQKFGFFMIAFGVWDIFFYVWLWVAIRWPESLLTWDLLFLLPVPWVAPVIAPVLIALALASAGSAIVWFDHRGYAIRTRPIDWAIILGCALAMIVSFCLDWRNILQVPADPPHSGVPRPFGWWLYLPAYVLSVAYFIVRACGGVAREPAAAGGAE
jgi:hypothetical protein